MRNKITRAVFLVAFVGIVIPSNLFVYATRDTVYVESVQSSVQVPTIESPVQTKDTNATNQVVAADIAKVLGIKVEEEETYSLVFGEELAKYDIVYKSQDSEDVLNDKFQDLNTITPTDLGDVSLIDIPKVDALDNIESKKDIQKEEKEKERERELLLQSQNNALLITETPDKNYKGTIVPLTAEDRDILERLVMGEAGTEGFEGAALVAQAIRDTMVYKGFSSVESVRKACAYSGTLTRTPNKNVLDAVKYIFDEGGIAVKHKIFYFYAHKIVDSAFHESQKFIVEYKGHRFFSTHN